MTPTTPTAPLPLPPGLQHLTTEIATLYRELPRLLAEGHAGRVALVKNDQVVGVWDTDEEVYQEAATRYGFGPYLAQPIDARDIDRLAPYDPAATAGVPA